MHGLRHALAKRLPWALPMLEKLELLDSEGNWPVPFEYMYKYSEKRLLPQVRFPNEESGEGSDNEEEDEERGEEDDLPQLLTIFAVAPKLHSVIINSYDLWDDERIERLRVRLPWSQLKQLGKFYVSTSDFLWLMTQCPSLIRCSELTIKCIDQGTMNTGSVRFPLQSLDIQFQDEDDDTDVRMVMINFLQSFDFPHLRELRVEITRDWTSRLHSCFIAFLSNVMSLLRLVIRMQVATMRLKDLTSILCAVPSLVELEICQDVYCVDECIEPMLNRELLNEFMLPRPRSTTPFLPKLHTLSLVGEMTFGSDDLADMLRMRMAGDSHTPLTLQRVYLYFVGVLRADFEFDLITDIFGNRVHMSFEHRVPTNFCAFVDPL
ncbi:hypothetical protein HWV62_40352 [Athelia sp. TMB]|nr:hypothetical protein HWV62_40352 [Athelia sp. TMB]